MEKTESTLNARRKILNVAVSAILIETGFESADKQALETMSEMLQSFLIEAGNSTKSYYEVAGRSEPVIADVIMALINMGFRLEGLESYAARPNRHVIGAPTAAVAPRTPAMLSAGTRARPPAHIPPHLPPLPDPHAYVRTPTHKQPVTEYEAIREKAANQKRDIERALTRFLAKTGETHSLFNSDDNQMFPLIACKPIFPAYLPALLPTDQVFDFEELEYHFQVANRTEDLPATEKKVVTSYSLRLWPVDIESIHTTSTGHKLVKSLRDTSQKFLIHYSMPVAIPFMLVPASVAKPSLSLVGQDFPKESVLEPISDGEEEGNVDAGEGSQEISGGQSPVQIDNPYLKHTQKSS